MLGLNFFINYLLMVKYVNGFSLFSIFPIFSIIINYILVYQLHLYSLLSFIIIKFLNFIFWISNCIYTSFLALLIYRCFLIFFIVYNIFYSKIAIILLKHTSKVLRFYYFFYPLNLFANFYSVYFCIYAT